MAKSSLERQIERQMKQSKQLANKKRREQDKAERRAILKDRAATIINGQPIIEGFRVMDQTAEAILESALQSINESRYTLHVTFTINMIILCLCGLLIKNLLMLYVLLGIGYAAVYLVLYHRSRRMLNADLR